jgi:transposase
MIDYELYNKIKVYHEQNGLKPSQIAKELGRDVRTVEKWLREKRFRPRRASHKRASKLDAFKDSILRMLEAHPYTLKSDTLSL